MTSNDATNGDLTVVDLPMRFSYSDPNNGQIRLDTSIVEGIVIDWPPPPPPTCTTMEIIKLTIEDPDGLPFATLSTSTRAKDE